MKLVSFIIRPEKLEAVVDALNKHDLVGMMVTDVRGFGRQKGQVEHYRGEAYTVRFIPKVKVEVVLQEKDLSNVMSIVRETCRTGNIGDGKIFVMNVEDALRIRTGEKGASAL